MVSDDEERMAGNSGENEVDELKNKEEVSNSASEDETDTMNEDELDSSNDVETADHVSGGDELKANETSDADKIDTVDQSNNSKEKKAPVANKTKKIGPQKQKKAIHILLKKSKVYEIRKMTRRIETLRKLKGTEQQKAKNIRKVEKLIKEIEAMKGFIIETLTERTVDIFKGKAEDKFLEIWAACESEKTVEELLQRFSNDDSLLSDDKYEQIAFLRMLSSKDIVGKLRLVANGVNINAKKNKKMSKKAKKKQAKNSQKKVPKADDDNDVDMTSINDGVKENHVTNNSENKSSNKKKTINPKPENKRKSENQQKKVKEESDVLKTNIKKSNEHVVLKSEKENTTKDVNKPKGVNNAEDVNKPKGVNNAEDVNKPKGGAKKSKKVVDSFFLDNGHVVSDSDNGGDSDNSEEEFTAPVSNDERDIFSKKKNRMGQRQRKKILEIKQGKRSDRSFDRKRNGFSNKNASNTRPFSRFNQKTSSKKVVVNKGEVDKTLHPSWQAKQKLKKQENIVAFTGTKIIFD